MAAVLEGGWLKVLRFRNNASLLIGQQVPLLEWCRRSRSRYGYGSSHTVVGQSQKCTVKPYPAAHYHPVDSGVLVRLSLQVVTLRWRSAPLAALPKATI